MSGNKLTCSSQGHTQLHTLEDFPLVSWFQPVIFHLTRKKKKQWKGSVSSFREFELTNSYLLPFEYLFICFWKLCFRGLRRLRRREPETLLVSVIPVCWSLDLKKNCLKFNPRGIWPKKINKLLEQHPKYLPVHQKTFGLMSNAL